MHTICEGGEEIRGSNYKNTALIVKGAPDFKKLKKIIAVGV